MELPDQWFVDNDGQSRVLDPEKVEKAFAIMQGALEFYAGGTVASSNDGGRRALDALKASLADQ